MKSTDVLLDELQRVEQMVETLQRERDEALAERDAADTALNRAIRERDRLRALLPPEVVSLRASDRRELREGYVRLREDNDRLRALLREVTLAVADGESNLFDVVTVDVPVAVWKKIQAALEGR